MSLNSSIIVLDVLESSAPVGSSASNKSGSLISARQIATRCCSPPDISKGYLLRSGSICN